MIGRIHALWLNSYKEETHLSMEMCLQYCQWTCHAHSSVNVDNAAAIGDHILEKMVGEKVSDFSF